MGRPPAFPNQCRSGSINGDANFASGPSSCYDPFTGTAFGTVTYEPEVGGINRARLIGTFVVPFIDPAPYPGVTETYAFRVTLTKNKTVSACAGCAIAVCLVLREITVQVGGGEPDRVITSALDRAHALWQSSPILCGVPARKPTWGSIKALYR